ncbi:unnamed protein product [Phaedon cochleariae]|uniref:Peptidase S1 domain-containing protein n=1 Tax=Phaedon cochleariae TaxID=80249 RepID=A0A9P0GNC0_PHACE|nr:unnamed protein product [Phaedon cochleariae]
MLTMLTLLTKVILILGILGKVSSDINQDLRIIGGQDADIADYPYQLSLSTEDIGHFCGAVLISPTWALSGAHCMLYLNASSITVLSNSSSINTGLRTAVSKIITHEKYDYDSARNDIALLQLTTPIICSNCQIIKLGAAEPRKDEMITITGWGTTNSNDTLTGSDQLQALNISVIDTSICQENYNIRGDIITDGMFCAGNLEGGEDACVGDSGGPGVINGKVAGIVSWGHGCAEPGFPTVYTKVSAYLDWIYQHSSIKP